MSERVAVSTIPGEVPTADQPVDTSVVSRLIRVLESVAEAEETVGVRSLARQTGIDKSSISRILRQLAALEMVDGDVVTGRYRIGPRFLGIAAAAAAKDDLTRAAKPILEQLVIDLNETGYLAIWDGNHVVYRHRVECNQPVRYVAPLGAPSPLYAGAGGRAILSALPEPKVRELLLTSRLVKLTPNTVTDRQKLRALRDEDRVRGYSVSVGERIAVGVGVAAPFFGPEHVCIGSIVVAFPRDRLDGSDLSAIGRRVAQASKALSARLGDRTEG